MADETKERLSITRRANDTITNSHLQRLGSEGWSIAGVESNPERDFRGDENAGTGTFTVVFER